ncbi:Protein CBR-TAG-304 [Caenorhabditis briggsae]|uniref:CTLH domain-containing protein n=3 Tax=Caenorhabditis briggsae TaxID=6238 RepID=A0AAE9F4G2_CAEBR|nr:Protein CBR-TAG-304 [Caenorhabditis briggsae]ULT88095.1 hypothetical protein L3Y34_007356 [Caenorhabditis briggsae]UMM33890.1 hypothetical protein L5515_007200 [Caenorhabditis briggsae]CAP26861.1 Protein CBR-TAG-304 [Caenorhabditis briggsae]
MAHRDHRYHLNNPVVDQESDEDEEEEVEEEGDFLDHRRADIMELDDSPNEYEDYEDAQEAHNSEGGGSDEDAMQEDDDEDVDDAVTWDTLSEASDVEEELPEDGEMEDEWYPLIERKSQFPNFALPTTTRQAINPSLLPSSSSRRDSTGSADFSDCADPAFNNFVNIMRPDPTRAELLRTTLEYFLHNGLTEVVETFCREMKINLPEKDLKEMHERNKVRDLILAGEMDEAIKIMPERALNDDNVNFEVRKQHIIEMIRGEQTEEPVLYFREQLMKHGKRPDDEKMDIIEKIFTLMVYGSEENVNRIYFEQSEREKTAKIVNSAMLGVAGKSRQSHIDFLAKSIIWGKNDIVSRQTPKTKTSTHSWAHKYFSKPFAMKDLVEKGLKVCPIDETRDLS